MILPIILMLAQLGTPPTGNAVPVKDDHVAMLKAQYLKYKAQRQGVESQIQSLLIVSNTINSAAEDKLKDLREAGKAYCKEKLFNPEEQNDSSEAGSCVPAPTPSKDDKAPISPQKPEAPTIKH